jgi:hypothetical protein
VYVGPHLSSLTSIVSLVDSRSPGLELVKPVWKEIGFAGQVDELFAKTAVRQRGIDSLLAECRGEPAARPIPTFIASGSVRDPLS